MLAKSRVLIAFDFDGTLSRIVSDPDQAAMRPRTRDLLARVCAGYPSAVISGRDRSDVTERLDGAGVRHVIGNHGLEPSQGLEDFARATKQAIRRLSEQLASRDDVDIEHKRYSLAIHYRRSRRRLEAEEAIRTAIDGLPAAMRLIPGKLVLNLVPHGAPNKGDALRRLKEIENCDGALYVGDDVTDEDVFRMERSGEVVAVRVGRSKSSAASWHLEDQSRVDDLLAKLASLREVA
jgi:trehalose 6-phosphate phosphatase